MCGLVLGQHEVDNVELGADEDDLEHSVPQRLGRIGPEEVEVAGDVDGEVEELGFEGDAGCGLRSKESAGGYLEWERDGSYGGGLHFGEEDENGGNMAQVGCRIG